jgi:hypothetical protein
VAMDLDKIDKLKPQGGASDYITPMWQEHTDQLMSVIIKDPGACLRDPVLQYAFNLSACGVYAYQEIPYLEERYPRDELKRLLKEGAFPGQTIFNPQYETSETRVNHLTHLTAAAKAFGDYLSVLSPVVEFGGGYGGMAHLIRALNPSCTHIIIDLPEMIVFQAYTLGRLFGPDALNFVTPDTPKVREGCINFISIEHLESVAEHIDKPDLFIATWSLSEANSLTNALIQGRLKFLGARRILFGYRRYQTPNPRQPESKPLDLPDTYDTVFHGPCFFALENEMYYQFAKSSSHV